LAGGLRVLEKLGETSAGLLFRAEDPARQLDVALMILRPEEPGGDPSGESAALARLREQTGWACQIQHPNVAAAYATGVTDEGWVYLVLENLQGELLSEILDSRGPLPVQEAMDCFRQTAAGLRAAHLAGIVHGNLSPHSILVTQTADRRRLVKLIAFELAALPGRPAAGPSLREVSAEYASPERLAGRELDARSDVFSLGAVVHHLLTGVPPRSGLGASIPEVARAVLVKAMAPAPGERFQTVSEFVRALHQATPGPRRVGRAKARRLLLAGASGAALGVVVAVGLWLGSNPPQDKSRGASESGARPPAAMEHPEGGEASLAPLDDARLEPDESASDSVPRLATGRRARRAAPPPPEPEPAVAAATAPPPEPPPVPPAPSDSSERLPRSVAKRPPLAERPPPVGAKKPIDAEAQARAAAAKVVAGYARALETLDVVALSQAYPGLTERERAAWEQFFKVARDFAVILEIERFSMADSMMQLGIQGKYEYWNRSLHRTERAPVNFSATLTRGAQGWRLAAVR
jgi:serine/threonine-protein kinase